MRYNIIYISLLLLLAGCFYAQAQRANGWLFGGGAGLTWNTKQSLAVTGINTGNATLTGLPTPLDPGTTLPIKTSEGCFVVSDESGNLMFYSDGITIWDRNHEPMPNANGDLTGHSSSAHSGIVMPVVGDDKKYYVFTLGADENKIGLLLGHVSVSLPELAYSVVDMNLNGGKGDVVEGKKNIPIRKSTYLPNANPVDINTICEQVSVVKHANGKDFWLAAISTESSGAYANFDDLSPLTPECTSSLHIWLVDKDGVTLKSTTPIMKKYTYSKNLPRGQFKFDLTGKYFAWATRPYDRVYLGEFNTSTGQVSKVRYITVKKAEASFEANPYGVEFSKSGKNLFYDTHKFTTAVKVDELMNMTPDATGKVTPITIKELDKTLKGGGMEADYNGYAALQMGPDGRIYAPAHHNDEYEEKHPGYDKLFIIDNPEEENFNNLLLYRTPANFFGPNREVRMGLPTYCASWVLPAETGAITGNSSFCRSTNQSFSLSITNGTGAEAISRVEWNFGDGSNIVTDTNIDAQTKSHTYTQRGSYTITVIGYKADGAMAFTRLLTVKVNSCRLPVNHNLSTVMP